MWLARLVCFLIWLMHDLAMCYVAQEFGTDAVDQIRECFELADFSFFIGNFIVCETPTYTSGVQGIYIYLT